MKKCLIFANLIIVLSMYMVIVKPIHAQQTSNSWSTPVNISKTTSHSHDPSIAVDAAGGVHVVWREELGFNSSAVYYSYFNGESWTTPIDIFLDAAGPLSITSDSTGLLHLVWVSSVGIQYSNAPAATAASVRGWKAPVSLYSTSMLTNPDLIVDIHGTLHLVFSKTIGETSGIYYMSSEDQGDNWFGPILIYKNVTPNHLVYNSRIAVGLDDKLYAVWVEAEYPDTYPPLGIRYASSTSNGDSWSTPVRIAEGPYDYPEIITSGQSNVHIVFSGTEPDRYKLYIMSKNSGLTWSSLYRDTELGGYQGWPALAVDGDQNLYWIQVGTLFQRTIAEGLSQDVVYFQSWQNDSWTAGEIIMVTNVLKDNMRNLSAAVGMGNELHLIVEAPLKVNNKVQWEIYYLHKKLAASGTTPIQLSEQTDEVGIDPTNIPTQEKLKPNPTQITLHYTGQDVAIESPWLVVAAGIVPVIALLFILMVWKRKNNTNFR